MKLIFLLIISSTLIPFLMAAGPNWIKNVMEKLHLVQKNYTKLQKAMLKLPFESIKDAIERASDSEINAVNKRGMNAAHMAAALGKRNELELLYAREKNLIFTKNNAGHEAIHVAAKCGEADVVKFLVTHGNVEVDVQSGGEKMTSLQLAAELGWVDVIKALVELKADIDACDENEGTLTPLAYAVIGGHFEATKTLLELGADKEKRIPFNESLNQYCKERTVRKEHYVLYNTMRPRTVRKEHSVPYNTMRPLPIAVYMLNIEIAELLLTHKVETIYGHFTILHYLSDAPPVGDGGKKVEAMLDMLIEKQVYGGVNTGIHIHSIPPENRNLLYYTVSRRNYEMFHVLIRKINEDMRPGNSKVIWTELLDDEDGASNNALSTAVESYDMEMAFTLMRTKAMRVGAANFYMDVRTAHIIMSWFKVDGSPILLWKRRNFKRPEKFSTFCETLLQKYEETLGDMPRRIAGDLSSIFPWCKFRNLYPFYLALKSYYSEYLLWYEEEEENRELVKKLSKEYRNHREKKKECLENEEDRIKLLNSSKENDYILERRIRFLNLLKGIYVWRPELEEDAFILAHLKTKFEFVSNNVKEFFS